MISSEMTPEVNFMSKTLLCFGDSNTWGYDPRSYFGEQYPETVRWTGLLAQRGWQVENWGHNGLAIPRNPKWVLDLLDKTPPPRYMAIMLGGNDLLQSPGLTAEGVAERMEGLLSALLPHPALKDTTVLLIAPPPVKWGDWVTEERLLTESGRLGDCYRQLAQKTGIPFGDAGSWNVELTYDGVHFSEGGHAAFSSGLLALLEG